MQNITKRFRVTDGNNVTGQFQTLKRARYYLVNSRIWDAVNLVWKPIREDGFYIEKFDDGDGCWKRPTYIVRNISAAAWRTCK